METDLEVRVKKLEQHNETLILICNNLTDALMALTVHVQKLSGAAGGAKKQEVLS